MSEVLVYILLGLITYNITKPAISKDLSQVWSPVTVISLVYGYYCIVPYFFASNTIWGMNENMYRAELFHGAALLSYVCILWGFRRRTTLMFHKWNKYITNRNAPYLCIGLFLIYLCAYVPFNGFHLTIGYNGGDEIIRDGLAYYFDGFIKIIPVIGALALFCLRDKNTSKLKKTLYLVIIWIGVVALLVAGFRARIVIFTFCVLTFFYLYPTPRRINYLWVGTIGVALFLLFSIMDTARTYSAGIDLEKASELSYDDIKGGSRESYVVYNFSIKSMDYIEQTGEYRYFDPILNAVCMPIPRAIFPWKPKGEYMYHVMKGVNGTDAMGSAYLMVTEMFLSFGWLGIIIFSYLFGWLSKIFWNNYRHNPESIGAIILLGAYNGFCYVFISRGYMAQAFDCFVYVICLPFWLMALLNRFNKHNA